MWVILRRLWQDEWGQDLTEYGLLLAVLALACIAAMQNLASAISNVFGNASSTMAS